MIKGAAKLIKQHHERYDGKGYPSGYKGEKIELGARIMAAAKGKSGALNLGISGDKRMKASVIIATYNRSGPLKAAIDSVLSNTYPDFDLTIVDQSENNETRNLVEGYAKSSHRIEYLRSKKGRARALNLGIRKAIGEVIAKTDDDCTVAQDWIERIVSFFESHPDAAIVLGDVTPGKYDPSSEVMPMWRSRNRKYLGPLSMKKGIGVGANISIKRWVFEKVGWFDEILGSPAHLKSSDDWDFLYRTLANGYSVYDTDLIEVQHNGRRSFAEAKKLQRGYQISTTAFLVKNLRCGDFSALIVLIGTTWIKFHEIVEVAKFIFKSTLPVTILKFKFDKCLYYIRGIYWLLQWTFIGIFKSFEYSVDKDKKIFISK